MSFLKNFARTLATALVASVALFAGSGAATAAETSAPAVRDLTMEKIGSQRVGDSDWRLTVAVPQPVNDDTLAAPAPEATYTFDHDTSVRIYDTAKSGGTAAVTAMCLAAPIIPAFVKPACAAFAAIVVALAANPLQGDSCYQVYAKFGWPPVGVRVVKCS
ncbi:hypothetical protein LX15_004329 [Streptoalloteichus tenebrarius]|uniref:Secreted protein n=1 Tax=Streptoalloteichus tenebrarius (strain ATCC 17920 / DSM 40477 / JCM 4838 / CBS 697.72 / NBRC 16177 / NCIMB 11028 / NRRL B-12390 / A12253. 1 / ISP 5477) TaxID=1933 RepID=A0ABT1HYP9_STRSD|nr:hypothetical protein [Streptoalloteichus tenebrarius]MCP2260610.1 hypothetical protein [Streptoalloteichus tenebrarius]BFF01493.1 hypothetical protein GCM10020241_31680 [Streptoalloteichus tenebrarius]